MSRQCTFWSYFSASYYICSMKLLLKILFVISAMLIGTVAMANSSPILNSKANSFSIFNFQFSINFADGRKLRYEASTTLQPFEEYRTYSGNLVFGINDDLEYIIIPEGRILYEDYDSTFTYECHLRDHLGSVRVAFTLPLGDSRGGAAVVQENSYYPFGSPINDFTWTAAATNRNIYLREGKEYIAMYGLNKYDFLNRTFDTWTLMALQIDPMAAKFYQISPYALWANNPMRNVDPDGRNPFDFVLLYFKLQNWAEEQMGAAQRLVAGTSGNINAPAEANMPQRVQDINTTVETMQDVSTVVEGAVSVAEGVGSIPGMDMVLDPVMGLTHAMNGDIENAVPYALGFVIPGVSGGELKLGKTVFKAFTSNNFRRNLGKLTGNIPSNSQAHHVFPQANEFSSFFNAKKINIHDPKFGTWWNSSSHGKNAYQYNAQWRQWISNNPNATTSDVMNYGRQIMEQYGLSVHY